MKNRIGQLGRTDTGTNELGSLLLTMSKTPVLNSYVDDTAPRNLLTRPGLLAAAITGAGAGKPVKQKCRNLRSSHLVICVSI